MEWRFVKPLKDESAIEKVEKELGIKFPVDFVALVKEYNNGSPRTDTFDTKKRTGKAFGELLNFNMNEKYNILYEYNQIKDKLPPKVYPFSGDAGGNYLCFDYNESPNAPAIVRWDHEQLYDIDDDELVIPDHEEEYQYYDCEFVAKDLTDLFTKLYTDDDDEDDDEEKAEVIWEQFMDEDKLKQLNDENFAQVNKRRVEQGLAALER